jgi:hypothetical protein
VVVSNLEPDGIYFPNTNKQREYGDIYCSIPRSSVRCTTDRPRHGHWPWGSPAPLCATFDLWFIIIIIIIICPFALFKDSEKSASVSTYPCSLVVILHWGGRVKGAKRDKTRHNTRATNERTIIKTRKTGTARPLHRKTAIWY